MADADDSLMFPILSELRADMRQQSTLLLQLSEAGHRLERRFGDIERRISDTRAEIELMLKAELLGQLTHFETQIDERIAQLAERLSALERPHG
jgi:predicted  nucleic acid-binding Zn-ribbon protein